MSQTLSRRAKQILFVAAISTSLGLTGCGGGGGSSPAPAPAPAPAVTTADEAARFLTQATFGPTDADIARVQAMGYSAWIDEQFALPTSAHLPYVQANYTPGPNAANFNFMQDSFWQQAIPAPDQLRQRVKFALSELAVVSARRRHDRGLLGRAGELCRSIGTARIRQLSPIAAGRGHQPDDGDLPIAPRQQEGQRNDRCRPRRELRPRSDAADDDRPYAAEHRRHTSAG